MKLEKGSRERPGDGCLWEEGEIQGRSIVLRGSVFRGVGGSIGKGTRREGIGREQGMRIRVGGRLGEGGGEGETRTVECGGVLESLSEE